jgi:hypothetical protein
MQIRLILFLFATVVNLVQIFGNIVSIDKTKNITVEIPEVQELVYIIFAITKEGISDLDLINKNSDYYKKVILHFDKYKNERIVKGIGNRVARNHYQIQMDASNYSFDKKGNLVRNLKYKNLSWGNTDYLKKYKSDLEDFSRKTNYRSFYQENLSYYENLIALLQTQAPVHKQILWLEHNFPRRYETIRVIFSPLNNGKHSTNYKLKDLTIWVSGPIENSTLSPTMIEMLTTRMLFTEIDHNYVNPISDQYSKKIQIAFKNRQKWTKGKFSNTYKNEYAVFNEYMTWSVFILYSLDNYRTDDYETIKNKVENQMTNYRGFQNFKEFNDKMIDLYKNKKKDALIPDLYLEILEWSKTQ